LKSDRSAKMADSQLKRDGVSSRIPFYLVKNDD